MSKKFKDPKLKLIKKLLKKTEKRGGNILSLVALIYMFCRENGLTLPRMSEVASCMRTFMSETDRCLDEDGKVIEQILIENIYLPKLNADFVPLEILKRFDKGFKICYNKTSEWNKELIKLSKQGVNDL